MLKLTPERAENRGKLLVADILKDIRHRNEAEHRRQVVRNMYYGNSERLDVHWAGASDIHLPIIMDKVDATSYKWLSALADAVPQVMLRRPADDPYPDAIREQEQFINWALKNDIDKFRETLENWIRNACLDPVSYVKMRWVKKERSTVEVHRLKAYWQPGDVTFADVQIPEDGPPQLKEPEDLLIEVFGAPVEFPGQNGLVNFEDQPDGSVLVDFVEDRRGYSDVRLELHDGEFVDEIEAHVFRKIVVRDAPVVEVVEFEDLIVPFRSECLQSAPRVTQQYWLTPSEIQELVDSGEWDLTDDDMIRIHAGRTKAQEEIEENDAAKRVLDRALGEDGKDEGVRGVAAFNEGKVLVFEVYARDDVNGDGKAEEVIYHIPYALKKVARADYLDSVFPHGRRPFADARWIPVSGRYMGISMGEVLAPIQVQINTTINQVNDAQTLKNNPFFFYVPTAMPKGGAELKGIVPGQGIAIGDTAGVMFPTWAGEPLANLSSGMDPVLMFADRLTISPMQSGSSQVRNAPRTARGTLALLSEGNQKLDNVVKRHQEGGWHEVVHQLMALYQYYMPDEKWYWVVGQSRNQRARVTHKQMRGRWEFLFQGNTVNTNREVQRILAQQRFQFASTSALYATDPLAQRELLRDLLQAHSEGTDVERLLPKLPGEGAYQHPPMTQKQENQTMKLGISLDVLPVDDHQAHIEELDRFTRSPEFETLPREYISMFAQHKRQHAQMHQAQIVASASGDAPQGTTDGGAEQSIGGDVGLGGLEGGVQ